jgi:hypothetical protein
MIHSSDMAPGRRTPTAAMTRLMDSIRCSSQEMSRAGIAVIVKHEQKNIYP